jgi:hypothetical protein
MINIVAGAKAAEDLSKAVGVVTKIVETLKANPDLAALKLGQALAEVAKTLQVVDNAAATFLSIGIEKEAIIPNSFLMQIDGGSLLTAVQRGRGHCLIIRNIYEKYLDKWFTSVLKSTEYDLVKKTFADLSAADEELFIPLEQMADSLQKEVLVVLDLISNGEKVNARARVLLSLPILRPVRKTMAKTMQSLYLLQSDFIDITGAVV